MTIIEIKHVLLLWGLKLPTVSMPTKQRPQKAMDKKKIDGTRYARAEQKQSKNYIKNRPLKRKPWLLYK